MPFKELDQETIASLPSQPYTLVAKGERIEPEIWSILSSIDQTIESVTRQKSQGKKLKEIIFTKDVMTLLMNPFFQSTWALLPLDNLVAWAYTQQRIGRLQQDFNLFCAGTEQWTVEIACDPERYDLIDAFAADGVIGLQKVLRRKDERLATDTPEIARCFFGEDTVLELGGSLEALPKTFAPAILGIVSSGSSLEEEGWLRLATEFPQAQLLLCQLMLVMKK